MIRENPDYYRDANGTVRDSQGNAKVAAPGSTFSLHETGNAVDINKNGIRDTYYTTQELMRAGLTNDPSVTRVDKEPWHVTLDNRYSMEKVNVFGAWEDKNDRRMVYLFDPDHTYTIGYKRARGISYGGWRLAGNTLTFIVEGGYDEEFENPIISKAYVYVIDINNIILIYTDGEYTLLIKSNYVF
jgi:hypothetical protein